MTTTDTLVRRLTDVDPDTRLGAALALGGAEHSDAAVPLVARLGAEGDATVREALTWATVQQAGSTLPLVLASLADDDAATRRQAAHVLSKIGGTGWADRLDAVLADPDPEVAVKAFRAAASTGDPAVVPALIRRLGDGDQEQRDALSTAFARLGEHGVDALVVALSDTDADVREHAADALGHLGSPAADAAVGALVELLVDAEPRVRLAAVSALGELDPELTADALRTAQEADDSRIAAVATALLDRRA